MDDAKSAGDATNGALAVNLEQLQQDLQLARELQQAMLPLQYPTFPRGAAPHDSALLFHHTYRSNSAIGGDFFAVFPLSETCAGIFICDVMGHGVRAALVAAMIGALLEESKHLAADPGALLAEINRGLIEMLQRARTLVFTSAFYLVADAASGQLRFANAGHPAPLHAHRAGRGQNSGTVTHLDCAAGPVLGMIADAEFPTSHKELAVGDLLLLFTDGLFEVTREDGELFGEQRVLATVRESLSRAPGLPIGALCEALCAAAAGFAAGFDDDLCVVALEVAQLGIVSGAGGRESVTGLFNGNYLHESLEREVHRAGRQGYNVGVIALDVSGLEGFSQRHGQHAADELLHEFGELLAQHTRRSDIACRPRATGFTLVLPEASPGNTQRKAESLCEILKKHSHFFKSGELALALGLASFPQHGATGEAIVQAAIEAMQTTP